jgi:phage/plasmid-like protein (TIGR03299 family)
MAHEFESGFFVTEPAWHGLGTVLQDPPTIGEALRCAGLDWSVSLAPLCIGRQHALEAPYQGPQGDEDGRLVSARAVLRDSDRSILGVVGPQYEPLQNADALAWFQPLVDAGHVRLEAAGSLRFGQRVWVLGRVLGSSADVVKRDRVDQFVLLANGHDGTMAIRCGFTAVRVVCQNTLTQAVNSASGKLLRIRHTKNAKDALTDVGAIIDCARAEFAATAEQFKQLARKGCDKETLKRYVREVFAIKSSRIVSIDNELAPADEQAPDESLCKRIVSRVVELNESGRGADVQGVRGTLWGAYNAITEYVSHERGNDQGRRVDSAWFGQGAQLSARALKVGLELAAA